MTTGARKEDVGDGGPAFPVVTEFRKYVDPSEYENFEATRSQEGMTLRDYFAAAALTGMIANPDISMAASKQEGVTPAKLRECFARDAYKQADQMLHHRSQAEGGGK